MLITMVMYVQGHLLCPSVCHVQPSFRWNTDWVLCVAVMSPCPGLVRVIMSQLVMSSHHVIMLE